MKFVTAYTPVWQTAIVVAVLRKQEGDNVYVREMKIYTKNTETSWHPIM
mgnify:CR=1 FL=1